MNNLIKQISYFLILLLFFFVFLKLNSSNNNYKPVPYDYNYIIVCFHNENDITAIEIFNDFNDYFLDVFVDSTDVYNLQNVLKITESKKNNFQYDILSCNNFGELFDLAQDVIEDVSPNSNLENLKTINSFIATLENYLVNSNINKNIGYDILLSLMTDYIPNNSFYNQKIILKVDCEVNVLDVYEIFSEVNERISKINYIEVNNHSMYNDLVTYNKKNNKPIDIRLDEYYIATSDNLYDLSNSIKSLNRDDDLVKINSIFKYINENTLVRGDRFKKIRFFSDSFREEYSKVYLSKNEMIDYFDDWLYFLQSHNDDLNIDYDLNLVKNELIINISSILSQIKNNNKIDVFCLYMQDCFHESRSEYLEYFCNIEPITLDYLNSSIKKEYYDEENNMFISKIYILNKTYKYKKYIHSLFDGNTTIFK